jgi:hypothetical protein
VTPIQMALAFGFALLLAGLVCWWLEILRLRARLGAMERRAMATQEEQQTSLAGLRRSVEGLEAQWREQRAPAFEAAPLRAGLNLSKRSQALRLHRRGEAPDEIAVQLELPVQEVELLLKVHEIVMRAL